MIRHPCEAERRAQLRYPISQPRHWSFEAVDDRQAWTFPDIRTSKETGAGASC
jgi:hypothetical protein